MVSRSRHFEQSGEFWTALLGTLHGINSDASFSYSFDGKHATAIFIEPFSKPISIIIGSKVIITGTNQFTNPSGVTNPSWQCIWRKCGISRGYCPRKPAVILREVSDGPHVITVNVTVSNQQTFWFDYIQYLPSPSLSVVHRHGRLAISVWDWMEPHFL